MKLLPSAFVLATCLLSSAALGQDAVPGDPSLPRALFDRGILAAREGRWTDARAAFEQSYALVARPITLLNLAGARAQTGMLVESEQAYRQFLADAQTGPASRHREAAAAALADVQSRLPTVRLRVEGLTPTDRVLLDARPLDSGSLDSPIAVNPGRHEIRVERDGTPPRTASVELAERDRATVVIDARPGASPSAAPRVRLRTAQHPTSRRSPTDRPRRVERSPSLLASPWFWLALGVVAIGAGVTAGVVASQPAREPTSGDIPPFRGAL